MADLKISALTASSTPLAGTEVLPIVQSSTTKQVSVANLTAGRAVSAQSITVNNTGLAAPVGNFQSGDQAGARVAVINSGAGGQTYHLVTGNPGVSNSGFALFDSTNSATRLYVGSSTGDLTLNTGNLVVSSGKGIDFSATSGTGTSELLADYEEGTWTATIIGSTTAGTASYTSQTGSYTKVGNIVSITLYIDWNTGTGTGALRISGLPFTSAASRYQSMTIGQLENVTKTVATTVAAQINPNSTLIIFVEIPTTGGANGALAYDAAGNIFVSGTYFV